MCKPPGQIHKRPSRREVCGTLLARDCDGLAGRRGGCRRETIPAHRERGLLFDRTAAGEFPRLSHLF